jgi:hypothetical protein
MLYSLGRCRYRRSSKSSYCTNVKCGQSCIAAKRFILLKVYDEFDEKVLSGTEIMSQIRVHCDSTSMDLWLG